MELREGGEAEGRTDLTGRVKETVESGDPGKENGGGRPCEKHIWCWRSGKGKAQYVTGKATRHWVCAQPGR